MRKVPSISGYDVLQRLDNEVRRVKQDTTTACYQGEHEHVYIKSMDTVFF